jgi:DNA relaxase NicK
MEEITYQIHWLSFTVRANNEDAITLYSNLFEDLFGKIQEKGNGGRGFKEIYHGLLELKIYLTPSSACQENYWHVEMPGQACENIPTERFIALGEYLEGNFRDQYEYKRLDFAFDHVGFEPQDIENAVRNEQVRSLAKRESLHINSSPYLLRDTGGMVGTYTVEFGSNQSERMITVYNKRGFTRLEFQMRDARADLVAKQLFSVLDDSKWGKIAISHLRDFIDIESDWWNIFVTSNARAYQTISRPREVSMNKLMRWMDRQVSPALSVAVDVLPQESIDSLLRQGRKRRGSRYDLLLQSHNTGSDTE